MKTFVLACALGISLLAIFVHGCSDKKSRCPRWAEHGFCKSQRYVKFLTQYCKRSCGLCGGGNGGSGGSGGSGRCGVKPNVRIVGGTEAPKGAWPWQAMIRTYFGSPFCGGTLVHPQWVVTAAHCVHGKVASSIQVRLGAHYRSGKGGTEQDIQVARIINHHSYKKPFGKAHDISLLKLQTPAKINRAVGLACLPSSSGSVADGKKCWVTGFGRLSLGGDSPRVLMQVSVPIVSQSKCKTAYHSIHDSMICAGFDQGGKDACKGDSGGPMVCEMNGKYYLEGVVSWGYGCAAPGRYGVYARVRYLRQWINNIMSTY